MFLMGSKVTDSASTYCETCNKLITETSGQPIRRLSRERGLRPAIETTPTPIPRSVQRAATWQPRRGADPSSGLGQKRQRTASV
ncbi:unnamed protein product [Trichogramma brassicae]|uniref:Uncharacterized protein n=1 Tax=Trichogramma brassicae TaxID=86971 RepID=A0A6H5HZ02_9HYME|nr:unnamed protein product [Trichogramma brassicae]